MNTITVHILDDIFKPEDRRTYETTDLLEFLMSKWDRWPDNAVLYHGDLAVTSNVTPKCDEDIERLLTLSGPFFVVMQAGTGYEILIYAVLFAVAYVVAKSVPNVPIIANRNTQFESPNNELANRENRARLKGRIPDIFGTVIATPDLISVPYFKYVDNVKVEHAYMCLGRGEYLFETTTLGGPYDIRDGDTLVTEIPGTSVEVYEPDSSPITGDPSIRIGDDILEPIFAAKRIDAVNGQTLLAPNDSDNILDGLAGFLNDGTFVGDGTDDFTTTVTGSTASIQSSKYFIPAAFQDTAYPPGEAPNGIYLDTGASFQYVAGSPNLGVFTLPPGTIDDVDWQVNKAIYIQTGIFGGINLSGYYLLQARDETLQTLTVRSPELIRPACTSLTSSTPVDGSFLSFVIWHYLQPEVDFSGTYDVSSATSTVLTLTDPEADNPTAWYWRNALRANLTDTISTYFGATDNVILGAAAVNDNWVGPFTVNLKQMENFVVNIVATQGMYRDNGTTQTSTDVDVQVELTPVNAAGAPIGPSQTFTETVVGSATTKSERAVTVTSSVALDEVSRYKVRVRRTTPKDLGYTGQIVDEVKWADLYGLEYFVGSHFGDVTTLRTMTTATTGALNIKSRKLTARSTRRVKAIKDDFTLDTVRTPSKRFCDILAHVCMDPYIGNRDVTDLDLQNFLETDEALVDYFGTDVVQQFSHTFDKSNLSFEETVSAVAEAVFCSAYREGPVIRTFFEKLTTSSSILFNHRNKIPKSESRTYQFGVDGDIDGVEVEYVLPEDGSIQTYYIPVDRSALKPKKFTLAGVADPLQAYFHAWREWNKIRYRRCLTEFRATQEAEHLLVNSRILVADNTRAKVQDGEIRAKAGLDLTTSQPVKFDGGPYYIFLQHTDGTVQSIRCYPGSDEYHVTLDSEPSAALSLDPDNYALTTYLIVKSSDVWPAVFLVQERETESTMVSKVTAVNYDDRYYDNDQDYVNEVVDANGEYL
jgi:hypothetical protein